MTGNVSIEEWEDYRYEIVPITNLIVDRVYQRRKTGLIAEIAADFRPFLVGTLAVSARKEAGRGDTRRVTEGAVFDGQQRLEGSKLSKNPRAKALPCIVYSGLSQQQEAELFELMQLKRRNMTSYDRFRASLVAKREESLTINAILESVGYEAGDKGASPDAISAIRALESIFRNKKQGIRMLERVLVIFKDAWKRNYVPSGAQLRGMARFLQENPDVDDERLVRRLFITSPNELDRRMMAARDTGFSNQSTAHMAEAIKAVYAMQERRVEREMASAR